MFSSIVIVIILFIFLLFFMFYKRDMLIKMFSIDVTSSANHFQQELEQTADIVIKRLEEQISHFEYLLEEANEKISTLDEKIQIANQIIETQKMSPLLDETNDETNLVIPGITIEKKGMLNSADMTDEVTTTNETMNVSKNHERPTYIMHADADKRSSIVEMADLGYNVTEIAQTTGISKGEIILLLQLNKK